MKIIPWRLNPDIGWWLDNEPLSLYFGCTRADIPIFDHIGIKAIPSRNKIRLAVDPYTALKQIKVPQKEQAVLLVQYPLRQFLNVFDSDLTGIRDKQRLLDKDRYMKFTRMDIDYYKGFLIPIRGNVSRRFISGVLFE